VNDNTTKIDVLGRIPRLLCQATAAWLAYMAWNLRTTDPDAALFAIGIGFAFLVAWGVLFWIDRIYLEQESDRWARAFGSVLIVSIWILASTVVWTGFGPLFGHGALMAVASGLVTAWPTWHVGRALNLPIASRRST
jgi:small-conductance mechanosensitive channel